MDFGAPRNDRGVADALVGYARDNRPSTGRGKWAAGYQGNVRAWRWFLEPARLQAFAFVLFRR